MTDTQNEKSKQDWQSIATEALDLWQNHLNSLANDPKIKEDMANFVAPMSQMFAQWTNLMQNSMQNVAGFGTQAPAQADASQTADDAEVQATAEAEAPVMQAQDAAPEEMVAEAAAPVQEDNAANTLMDSGLDDDRQEQPLTASIEPIAAAPEPATRGGTLASDGTRDLAQLASRLAELERELDSLRPKTKRAADASAATDSADAGAVQRVAGAGQG